VTRPPFGFGASDRPEEPEGEGGGSSGDPFGLAGLFGGGDLFAQLSKLMSWRGGPVNWDLATSMARDAAQGSERPVTDDEVRSAVDAGRLAELWLDPITTLPGSGGETRAWTRVGWIEETLPAWRQLVDPVAGRVVTAMRGAMEKGLAGEFGQLPEEMKGLLGGAGPLHGVMEQVGGFVFGAQVGQALGALAGEVLSSTEIGLPLGPPGRPALVPQNVAAFAEGLAVPDEEVRLYLALRECAHQRLFASVPWLKAHLFDTVDAYARGIEVDSGAIESAVSSFDPSDPTSLQRALGEGMFELQPTPAQQAALARLETALALVEGWVDAVVDAAASGPLPSAAALRETVRRRRATGGPAEQTFTTLVGLELRPRRLREAAALWAAVAQARGVEGRDALWAHPDLLPGPDDLDDPDGFVARTGAGGSGAAEDSGTDWDAELRGMGETSDDEPRDEPDDG
jgi:putative hydrolase